ncbi:MAG: ABC transporter substrate-binding protein [Proteobacteria bacterium]|nr:ABC transporter substrate-binding protein [Pseudomonadota bacterium]
MGKTQTIRIGHLKIIDHLILGDAVFRLGSNEASLQHAALENIPMNSWGQMGESLRLGDIDGAFMTTPLAMDLFAAGLDIRLLMFVHRSGSVLVKNRNAGIKNLGDLKGKTVLIPHELSVEHLLIHKLLGAANLTLSPPDTPCTAPGKIRIETASPFLVPQMLKNDEEMDIGACMVPEPYGSQAMKERGADMLCTSDSLWKDHPCCSFVMQADFCQSHGTAIQELVRLFLQSARRLDSQAEDTILDCVQNFLGQKENIARRALFNIGIDFNPQKLLPDRKKLDIIQTYMNKTMGILPRTIDLDAFVDDTYAIKAVTETNL